LTHFGYAAPLELKKNTGVGFFRQKQFDPGTFCFTNSSSTSAYQGGLNISADIQSLIQQLSSSSSSGSSSSNSSNSSTATLENFLKNLASNLEGACNSGNVVNTKV